MLLTTNKKNYHACIAEMVIKEAQTQNVYKHVDDILLTLCHEQ